MQNKKQFRDCFLFLFTMTKKIKIIKKKAAKVALTVYLMKRIEKMKAQKSREFKKSCGKKRKSCELQFQQESSKIWSVYKQKCTSVLQPAKCISDFARWDVTRKVKEVIAWKHLQKN